MIVSFWAGYGRLPYGVQQAGLNPEAKAAAQYGNNLKIRPGEMLFWINQKNK